MANINTKLGKKDKATGALVMSKENKLKNFFLVGIIILVALLFLFPFYWMIVGAFKHSTVAMQLPPQFFPKEPTLINFTKLFSPKTRVRMFGSLYEIPVTLRWIWNSFFVSSLTAFLVCIISAMAGYSLSKKKYPLRDLFFWLFIAIMALPKQVLLVPLFMMIRGYQWTDSYLGLILPTLGWPFGIFLMKQFAQTMPDELFEAASMDGCGEIRKFVQIALPMLKPAIGALAIFTFMSTWNDYFWQSIILTDTNMKTLQLGVESLQMDETTRDYGLTMAAATIGTLPLAVIFIMFQKYFTQGITMGAVKG